MDKPEGTSPLRVRYVARGDVVYIADDAGLRHHYVVRETRKDSDGVVLLLIAMERGIPVGPAHFQTFAVNDEIEVVAP